jgi:membrane-associated phospholipid phosphatase
MSRGDIPHARLLINRGGTGREKPILLAILRSFASSLRSFVPLLLLASVAHADSTSALIPGAVSPTTSFSDNPTNTAQGTADVHLSQSASAKGPAWAQFASGTGTALFVGSGTLLPLVEDGRDRNHHALRAADSLLTSALITEALKTVTHSKRPDGSDYKSFPSGHATAAFAVASMQAHFHPNQAIFWYLGATAISASRVKLRRHRIRDIVAGAAIGIATTEVEYRQSRGLLLFPFIHGGGNSRQSRVSGLSFGGSF